MYAIERTRIIKKYLEEHGQAQVQALSSLLNVSEVTVRRDLERLEAEGWLTRTHGGALLNREDRSRPLPAIPDSGIDGRLLSDIAAVAVKMIRDGDVIMLGNGPANRCLAAELVKRSGLMVLTNDLAIALQISSQEGNRVVLLGGELDRQEGAAFGSMALSNLRKYYVNQLFIEPDGVNSELLFTVNSQEKADLILGAREVARETVALCPAPIFDRNAFFRLGDLRLIDRMVTNSQLDDEYKSRIFKADMPLFTPASAFEGTR